MPESRQMLPAMLELRAQIDSLTARMVSQRQRGAPAEAARRRHAGH
jgi:hypothetical protein